jgi:bifunctional DNase/RNase
MIHKLKKGIFYSYLLFELDGELKKIDSRTSDAVALALRFNCPIYTYESILDKAGVILDDDNSLNQTVESPMVPSANLLHIKDDDPEEWNMTRLSDKTIQKKLEQALESENYELAALLRDELQKRNSGL